MKKLIFIFFLITSQSFAQLTLTSAINPSAGDVNHYTLCDTTNITEGNSGANQNWSFQGLIRTDSSSVNYVSANSTLYTAQFPTSNIASTEDESTYNYVTVSSANLISNGAASPGLVINYSDPQTYLQYPFTYSSSFTDNFSAHYNSGGIEVFSTGTTTVTGDAWGTINLPSGSFTNALRVRFVTVTNDSSTIGISTFVSTSYTWFVSGRKFPVFTISYVSFSFNGFPLGNEKIVNYSGNTTIGINNVSSEIPGNYKLSQNYPNPFNPATNLEFAISKSGFVSLKIHDMAGKEAATLVNSVLNPGTYKYSFDASDLTSGIYFYTLKADEFIETKKMTLIK